MAYGSLTRRSKPTTRGTIGKSESKALPKAKGVAGATKAKATKAAKPAAKKVIKPTIGTSIAKDATVSAKRLRIGAAKVAGQPAKTVRASAGGAAKTVKAAKATAKPPVKRFSKVAAAGSAGVSAARSIGKRAIRPTQPFPRPKPPAPLPTDPADEADVE